MTPDLLRQIMPRAGANADIYAYELARACERFQINTKERLAAFLAQIAHESGQLRFTKEVWGPTPAQDSYEGRKNLGNTEPGDGKKFLGRGLIQITGRANYHDCSVGLFGDGRILLDNPALLEEPKCAALSAAWFWAAKGCNQLADSGDFLALTKRINGGTNGLAEREAFWEAAKRALQESSDDMFHVEQSNTGPIEGKKMTAPLLLALAPMIAELIPQVAKLFSSGSEVATRNVAAVEAVAKTVVAASGSSNVQEAIEKMQADPALATKVQQAVVTDPIVMGLLEVGGGVAKAREVGLQMQGERTFLWNPLFWMSLVLLPLASYVVFAAVTGGHAQAPWWVGAGVSAEAKVGIISSVISLIIGGICGIWFGTSYGSQRKDEMKAAQQ